MTSAEMKVQVTLTNIVGPAADSTFGLSSPAQQQAAYQAVINSVNSTGGVACRKLVPTYVQINPADQADLEQACLDAVQEGVFAELDQGGYAAYPQKDCYAQNHIPFFGNYLFTQGEASQFYPYLFDDDTLDSVYRNAIFALKQRGFFSPANGFTRLGFVYQDCYRSVISEYTHWLSQVGVPGSQIVSYDVGCPSALASPSDIEQAILKFQQNHVTAVTGADFVGNWSTFTAIAEQQGFHPKYGLGDDAVVAISYGSQKPDANNFNGATAITPFRWGEERTPGMSPTAETARCNSLMQGAGQGTVYQEVAAYGGYICDQVWEFQAAVDHAPALSQTALAAGLQAAGSVGMSFPLGPDDFAGQGITWGGQYWRVDQFFSACACWRVTDPTFRPSFP